MNFHILRISLLILHFALFVKAWGYNKVITPDELESNQNSTQVFFEKGLEPHTAKVGFRLRNSENNEVNIFFLTTKNSKLSIKYKKSEHKLIFHMNMDIEHKTRVWQIQYPEIYFEIGVFHYLVYRLGKEYFKLWVNCELKRSTNSDLKTFMNFYEEEVYSNFGKNILLKHGDVSDIEYNQQIKFVKQPNLGYSFEDRSACEYITNKKYSQIKINDNKTDGSFYPLNEFQDALKKFNYPDVYYELSKSTIRDVSEFFEDGLDKDHSFEMTYRIKQFPQSNYSYYFILLRSGAESELSIALHGKRKILRINGNINSNDELINYSTEYWADKIYNNDWHKIKYTIKSGIFTLWIDNEIMEDFLGYKEVDLKRQKYDNQYLWYDTALMILEPRSGLHEEPILHIRNMKYSGNAITTNNTEISLNAVESEKTGYFESFFKVLSRTFSSI
ncbi:uncharacterized protein LOC129609145 [Condylostylus longicornis]|uniref:uncharacterized protein LOC129609145 n=1 Tax=Condylostylus longicornis TaxID=2530218 RepID=UPI00244DC3CC|nr:uncharacterized protein LOC129609145 [Condylostylus longicornis]